MINILFGGNYKVFDGILLCLMSITKHTTKPLNVFILTADVSELNSDFKPISKKQTEFLQNYLKQTNIESSVTLIKLDNSFNNWINLSKNKTTVYTPFAFLRLFVDSIKTLPNKVIYLDTDIMLNGDINELFNIDISNYELAIVLDRYGKFFIKPNYFNSGVMLINLQKVKETKLFEKVRNYCQNKKMDFPDQSALNKFCKFKLYLPRKFNEQGKLKNNTVLHHFSKRIKWLPFFHTVNIKPWQIDEVQNKYKCHAYDDIYEEFKEIKNKY